MEPHPYTEDDVIRYLGLEIPDESVTRIELVHTEGVGRKQYEVWDVETDADRYWVVSPLTNFYLHSEFPSMHAILSLHIGLMQRMLSRQRSPASDTARDRLLVADRHLERAGDALDLAVDAPDFQAVAQRCRETLLAVVHAAADDSLVPEGETPPKRDDFKGWVDHIVNALSPGVSRKAQCQRALMRKTAKAAWDYVGTVVHDKSATRFEGDMVLDATGHVFAMFALAVVRAEEGNPFTCPECGSYDVRDHYHAENPKDEQYVWYCSHCHWEQTSDSQSSNCPYPRVTESGVGKLGRQHADEKVMQR